MRRYILNRIILGIITLLGVSIIIFVAARLSGDVAVLMAPANSPPEVLDSFRAKFGLDKPIIVQYLIFIRDALQGDFGTSIQYDRPVMEIVAGRIPATLKLGLTSFVLGTIVGLILGIVSAIYRGRWLDWGSTTFSLLGQAIPNFWLAIMLMIIFAVQLHWLPTSGMGGIEHLVLPVISTSWFSTAFVLRITRSSMLDVLDTEYIKMARIKGVTEYIVILKHALRNALIPVVTLSGMQLVMIMGGLVFTEKVFNWPGIGMLMVNSIGSLDYPMIQAITLILSTFVVLVNLIVDLLFVVIDPRIKYE